MELIAILAVQAVVLAEAGRRLYGKTKRWRVNRELGEAHKEWWR